EQLTRVAEQVAVTGELDQPVLTSRHDEVGRLARAFSSMLAALRQSRTQQQQLVEDASHELRTPLTSMSTNIDTLRRHQDLNPEVRDRVLASLAAEVKALRSLTNELVELTMSARIQEVEGVIDLDVLVQRAVAIVAQRSGRQFDVDATPSTVVGRPEGLLRAIVNVLDNATKFSPAPSPIEVTTRDGRVVVRDHGAGIAARDLSHVFDRFYRAVEARSQPGSGLGLAIVRDVVEACGGEVTVANHVDGGAVFSIQLPMISAESEQEHPHPSNR
ncbi:MAG: HAMP domain-containing histidine kinase, partial [Actinobacteria bacterium]